MLRSFFSGVAGLRNHQQSMDIIGNNIANVNTPGFKGSRVTFLDTLSQTIQGARGAQGSSGGTNPLQVGLGMTVASIDRDFNQGALQTTGRSLDLAIEGNGFFIVGEEENFFYTRAGAFSVDDSFNLVTTSGEHVYGWIDTDQDGTIQAARDEVGWINLDRRGDGRVTNVLASATPVVNGPNQGDASIGQVTTFATTVSERWTVTCVDAVNGIFEVVGERHTPVNTVNPPAAANSVTIGDTFSAPEVGSFIINGAQNQAVKNVDTNGNGQAIRFTANDWGAGGDEFSIEFVQRPNQPNLELGTAEGGNHYIVYLQTDPLTGAVISTENDVVQFLNAQAIFNSSLTATLWDLAGGAPVAPGSEATDTAQSISSQGLEGGSGANPGDHFTFTTTAPGGAEMESVSITRNGEVVGIFENGTTEVIARVALASVPNPAGLLAVGQGMFAESPSSGSGFPPQEAGTGGTGTVASGFLEMSNVDLTQGFTDMIVTQRGFQANSRIITTSDEMLQDLLALKR